MVIGNMHKKLLKIVLVISETDTQADTQTRSLQYFAAVPAGEIIRANHALTSYFPDLPLDL